MSVTETEVSTEPVFLDEELDKESNEGPLTEEAPSNDTSSSSAAGRKYRFSRKHFG